MSVSSASPAARVPVFLQAIKFSHSVFALPFALIAMLIAAGGIPGLWDLLWIIIACVAARTAAMAFNRIVDREYDSRNPRTATRPTVTGALDPAFMMKALLVSAGVFILAAAMLNSTCFILSVPVLAVLLGYSLTKRFTRYSHFFLGLALGLAPLGAWIAITESLSWTPLLLSAAVILWVAGFDILYSCQDYEVDVKEGELHSLPKRLGIAGAMRFARGVHAGAALFFLLFWWSAPVLGIPTLIGVACVAGLLVYQHSLVSPRDLSRINAAFFTANGAISILFFVIVLLDVMAG
jgi:4-hydroxybenzoate polyprenyltransferase